ncbi:MAG: transaldolase, partial [Phototrophicaceae bacterium]
FRYFFERTEQNGAQFIAITDPGSALQKQAESLNFRDVFLNPADIGGRYSALSYFGLVPAALMGLDLDRLWDRALNMMKACAESVPEDRNPGAILGAVLGELGKQGRDKICIFTSDTLGNFGDWVEQLIAESTGKEGKGLIPVAGTTIGRPHDYDSDRTLVYLKVENELSNIQMDGKVRALREAGHPRVRLLLSDSYDLAGEFFRWEYATAVAGHLLGINPFDEPNVTESKRNTGRLLRHYQDNGELPQLQPVVSGKHLDLYIGQRTLEPLYELCRAHNFRSDSRTELIAAQLIGTRSSDYLAILAYVPTHPEIVTTLEHIARRLRHVTRRAVTVGYGPRYLHSTGQLHKGGPNNGVFLQITAELNEDLPIPGEPYSFGTLNMAQAAGDLEALQDHNRRVLRLHVKGDVIAGINRLQAAIDLVDERRQ